MGIKEEDGEETPMTTKNAFNPKFKAVSSPVTKAEKVLENGDLSGEQENNTSFDHVQAQNEMFKTPTFDGKANKAAIDFFKD